MNLDAFLAGVGFRTNTPDFDPESEFVVVVTGTDAEGRAVARIGDSVLTIHDAPDGSVRKRVRVRVTDWDAAAHTGDAEFLETVGDAAF